MNALVTHVPLTKQRGVFKPCMWCKGALGRVEAAPLIEPARHAGRMICEGCNRQIGWLSASAFRRAEATGETAIPVVRNDAGLNIITRHLNIAGAA